MGCDLDRTLNHLGALGLLADLSLQLQDGKESEEWRDSIELCLREAEKLGMIRVKRVLSRMEVEPAASSLFFGRAAS